MTREALAQQIKAAKSYLCVGLDTDLIKIPTHLQSDKNGVLHFNRQIIDATKDYCVSYKINTAFYESMGIQGWEILQETVNYIPKTHFTIADAKRGDIGNTSAQYAKTFFEVYGFDSVTVNPYMGEDSVRPFLEYEDKWTIVLGLTSNAGAQDFEMQKLQDGDIYLYEHVMKKVASWGTPGNVMFVVGATQTEQIATIREQYPEHFFLVPGVGAQGGSIDDVSKAAITKDCGLLINASRAIIYASGGEDFAEEAGKVAKEYANDMAKWL
jgi:orotidine-5'-phosphate decarboxylase